MVIKGTMLSELHARQLDGAHERSIASKMFVDRITKAHLTLLSKKLWYLHISKWVLLLMAVSELAHACIDAPSVGLGDGFLVLVKSASS